MSLAALEPVFTTGRQCRQVQLAQQAVLSGLVNPLCTSANQLLRAFYCAGTDTIDAKNVSFVKMHLPFANITGLNYSACDSTITADEFADGHFAITVFFGMTENTVFPYGFNNSVVAPANSAKFSIDAKHW